MKERYIELMERALSAYSDDDITRYFNTVREVGLTEHGFPRLAACIGILIGHGRRCDLLPVFCEMMELCADAIPRVEAGNNFSVREILSAIRELDGSGAVDTVDLARWRGYLREIRPEKCYTICAMSPEDNVRNWALFAAVSESFRMSEGLCKSEDFIELQLSTQLRLLDEYGMYMDNESGGGIHHPMTYDLVARGLFALLLNNGYRGKYYREIDDTIRRAGLLTLDMQSSNGEIAYGGRSNQFIHCEAWLACVLEYEAKRYKAEGNTAISAKFKRAAMRALDVCEEWLSKSPITHIKNRFPRNSKYGCEEYAYFDKYMITVASNLYAAYLVSDDSILPCGDDEAEARTLVTSPHFHKLFMKSGEYALELDSSADPEYDASGIGRIHRKGTPSPICLSVPCPDAHQVGYGYSVDIPDGRALSICPAVRVDGNWLLGTYEDTIYVIKSHGTDGTVAFANLGCTLDGEREVGLSIEVSPRGVTLTATHDGDVAIALPAFLFDGETRTEIATTDTTVSVKYLGYECKYEVNGGKIVNTGAVSANRNGHYLAYLAIGSGTVGVTVKIERKAEAVG